MWEEAGKGRVPLVKYLPYRSRVRSSYGSFLIHVPRTADSSALAQGSLVHLLKRLCKCGCSSISLQFEQSPIEIHNINTSVVYQ